MEGIIELAGISFDSPWKNSTGWVNICPDKGSRKQNNMIWQNRNFMAWTLNKDNTPVPTAKEISETLEN
jgi:hypothetical protein